VTSSSASQRPSLVVDMKATTMRTSFPLYMHNKKKSDKKKSPNSSAKGFAASVLQRTDNFPYAGSIRPGQQSPQRVIVPGDSKTPKQIVLPDYALDGRPKRGSSSPLLPWVIEVKTPDEIEKMRASGKLAREILDLAGKAAEPGVTTDEIDTLVHEAIVAAGAYPSPLNYHGMYYSLL
jgi:methionyl aminopeptidase